VWGDAFFHPRHRRAAEPILAAAARESELAGARRLEAWFGERPGWWAEELPRLGLVTAPEPNDLALIAFPDNEPEAIANLRDLYYYTMGDGDLF
jgi:hypothetical protein